MHADGSLATPPITLVEVQGYVFLAKRAIADCYERSGDVQQAQQLRREAEALRRKLEAIEWRPQNGFLKDQIVEKDDLVSVRAPRAA